jgi:hypothetical protein
MIVVRVELWPGGCRDRARLLGMATIENDGSGTQTSGNYRATFMGATLTGITSAVWRRPAWKTATAAAFPRERLSHWDLLYRLLRDIVGARNPS